VLHFPWETWSGEINARGCVIQEIKLCPHHSYDHVLSILLFFQFQLIFYSLPAQTIIEYYVTNGLPEGVELVNYKDGTISTVTILALILCRLFELDIIHRSVVAVNKYFVTFSIFP